MNIRDVELVLEKSLEFWREKLREKVSLVDIYTLAGQIWAEIQGEINVEKEIREYQLTRDELESLEKWGDIAWEEDDGSEVYIELVEYAVQTAMLESGKISTNIFYLLLPTADSCNSKNN